MKLEVWHGIAGRIELKIWQGIAGRIGKSILSRNRIYTKILRILRVDTSNAYINFSQQGHLYQVSVTVTYYITCSCVLLVGEGLQPKII